MSLDDIIAEAKSAGLGPNEIETAKRQYYLGVLKYEELKPDPDFHKFRSAILALHEQRVNAQYCGEAYARKYIRETVARSRKNEGRE